MRCRFTAGKGAGVRRLGLEDGFGFVFQALPAADLVFGAVGFIDERSVVAQDGLLKEKLNAPVDVLFDKVALDLELGCGGFQGRDCAGGEGAGGCFESG